MKGFLEEALQIKIIPNRLIEHMSCIPVLESCCKVSFGNCQTLSEDTFSVA